MTAEAVDALIARIQSMDADVEVLRTAVDAEALAANQRQYLARCFDLLHMELAAVRSYIEGLR